MPGGVLCTVTGLHHEFGNEVYRNMWSEHCAQIHNSLPNDVWCSVVDSVWDIVTSDLQCVLQSVGKCKEHLQYIVQYSVE